MDVYDTALIIGCFFYIFYVIYFPFVLHGHEGVKDVTRAGEKCITLGEAQMEATRSPKESARTETIEWA